MTLTTDINDSSYGEIVGKKYLPLPHPNEPSEKVKVAKVAKENCSTCLYGEEHPRHRVLTVCRRFPPSVASDPTFPGHFPVVKDEWWCGEYKNA